MGSAHSRTKATTFSEGATATAQCAHYYASDSATRAPSSESFDDRQHSPSVRNHAQQIYQPNVPMRWQKTVPHRC